MKTQEPPGDCPVCHGVADEDRLLNPSTVAHLLNVPRQTLLNWRAVGKGPPALHLGRHLRYRRASLNTWLDEQAESPDSQLTKGTSP